MKIIQEENYEYAMRNEVEPYLAAHCRDKFVTGAKEDGEGKTTRAAKLHVKFYETERPKGVVIVSHGFTEGVPKYDGLLFPESRLSCMHTGAYGTRFKLPAYRGSVVSTY